MSRFLLMAHLVVYRKLSRCPEEDGERLFGLKLRLDKELQHTTNPL